MNRHKNIRLATINGFRLSTDEEFKEMMAMGRDLPDDWESPEPTYKPTKTLPQLAAEYPDKPGLQQLAQAWEDGELF